MSKVLKCREVGMDCDFEARGENEQQIMQQVVKHAQEKHGIKDVTPELATKVKSVIHDEDE
jgi:predicted small metal-binding protein